MLIPLEIKITIIDETAPWAEILLSLGGVVLGFVLSEGVSFCRRRREINKEGESFDFEITSLKDPLTKQIEELNRLINELGTFIYNPTTIFLFKNLEFIKNTDRHKLNSYYEKKHGTDSLKKLRTINNNVVVIDAEISRFDLSYKEYSTQMGILYSDFNEASNKFVRALGAFHQQEKNRNDAYLKAIMELAAATVLSRKEKDNIMLLRDSLHERLMGMDYENSTHFLHGTISNFNQEGLDALNAINMQTNSFIRKVTVINTSLQGCLTQLFP
ncbi:MAG: hypothetical protein M3R17_15955 [Bacteroidota bacterium]|nr:hypothetical protein [Bacteroidota bacterium]